MRMASPFILAIVILSLAGTLASAQSESGVGELSNQPERLHWFQDQGLGLFVHWGVDSQIGSVISHSLVGASDDYLRRFFEELPATFDPTGFDADAWARLARVAGFRYVVFTTKHHSGFTMFQTETTDFGIMHTPFARDVTSELVRALRNQGLAVGFYFSPDDFHFLYEQGTLISRRRPEVQPSNNAGLMEHNLAQVRELLSNYGPIDVIFFDGPADGLLQLTWKLQPSAVVTRGAMKTPEITPSTKQGLPELTSIEPWEACFTMGTSWQFKPTNESYLPGRHWIQTLIETRAKGGNMLLNVGPTAEGWIPTAQEDILREIGLWMFVNREAVIGVRPWVVTNEGPFWFTQKENESAVYVFVTGEPWRWGAEKTIELRSVQAGPDTLVHVLGQNDEVLEYQPDVVPRTTWKQDGKVLRITATRAQRLYNDRTWPNPVVLKIENAKSVSQ